MGNFNEENLGHGCAAQPIDERDLIFEHTLGAGVVMTDKEWEEGYDIEKELGIKLKPNNQYSSYSCVGQAFSKYSAVLNFIETKTWHENSAKAIYSQISLGYGKGANLRDAANLVVNWGEVFENLVKSYKPDGTTDENWMIDKVWINEEINKLAKTMQSKEYRLITGMGIDYFARAIKDGHGMVAGVTGTNNGTWLSAYPKPPLETTPQSQLWGHGIYFGKFRLKDGKKQVGILESWGEEVGEDGWQWLGEEWFVNSNRWVFNPWVLVDKPNLENMIIKKEKTGKDIYLINEEKKTKSMIIDMPTLESLGGKFEEVDSLAGYVDSGTIAWFERKIN